MDTPRPHNVFRRALIAASAITSGLFMLGASTSSDKALKAGETGIVTEIVDGDTLFIGSELKVRLSAIQAPKLSLGRPHVKTWPLAHKAQKALSELALGQKVQLYYGGLKRDRYGRALAQTFLVTDQGERLWLQEEMIRKGLARVYTWPDTWQDSNRLYAAEQEARAAQKGIWAHPYYAIRNPDPNLLAQDVDSFQIVEGLIISTAQIKDRIYLNFGADYKTDFTIAIDKKDWRRFQKSGINPLELEGAAIRVRGWIEMDNGPIIWLDHPERLEILT